MAIQNLEQEHKFHQDDKAQLTQELNSLLNALVKPYKFIFDAKASKIPISPVGIITIKLNEERTLLCLEHNNNESTIENNGQIIEGEIYNKVRTILQNNRTIIQENKWDQSMKFAKQQIFTYLSAKNKLDDHQGFLKEFQKFINELPEIPYDFIECSRQLKEINFDDWDIEESEPNDPRLEMLKTIHTKMLTSFESYKTLGKNYIELKNSSMSTNDINSEKEGIKTNDSDTSTGMKVLDINMFNIIKIPKDGNCFYAAVADQLRRLDIKNKEATNLSESYYTHQDVRTLIIDYIIKNKELEFGKEIDAKLKEKNNTDSLESDLPSNIQTIDQYISHHCKEGIMADSGIIKALPQTFDIILRIYHKDNTPVTYNATTSAIATVKKIVNLQFIVNHYNSLIARPFFELLPFETKYPKQSYKIKRILEILNECERNKKLDRQIEIVGVQLGLSEVSRKKLIGYFNANSPIIPKTTVQFEDNYPWYTDEDMNTYGKILAKHSVNVDTQFSNRLTEDSIKDLPSIESLKPNEPRYICYNIGGKLNIDRSGIHWVAIFLVKREDILTILYKDSKGDWNNSSEAVANSFKEHYQNKVNFIKHSQAEQEDDTSCGPMTINNLEIMAKIIKHVNDDGKDGIGELIRLFNLEFEGIAFTTQDDVQSIRISHSIQNNSCSKKFSTYNANVDDLGTIITKLQLDNNDNTNDAVISMKDGKIFNIVEIGEDSDCYYAAVADHLKRLEIKIKNNQVINQLKSHYTKEDLKAITLDYVKRNGEHLFNKRIKIENKDSNGNLHLNINTIDEYISQIEEGTIVDSEIIEVLAQALDIRLNIYQQNGIPMKYNSPRKEDSNVKQIVNLQYTGNHYNGLIDVENSKSEKKQHIESYISKIDEYYNQIKNWGNNELQNWSREHNGQLSKNLKNNLMLTESIAIMDRVNELATGGHRLRNTQKAAILIFMQTNTTGHVSQINTGEGKTTIVSVVAALKVLQGYKSHIITSNNVLAADGAKDRKLFYDLLNITTADNNPEEKYSNGPRSCYSKDVVYGSMTSFQFDWLRHSFEQLNTLGDINYKNIWVMLDEIDSLLIDQGSNIAKLSGPFPGMDSLRYVYINIWVSLTKMEKLVTEEILEKLKTKADELQKDSKTDDNEKQIEYENYEDNLRESFLDEIKKHIKNQKNGLINKKILAKHLHEFAEDSVDRWIEHAFRAKYQYNENVEYKISKDKDGENIITPVDNQNTGVSMKNTILSNGLHQFLQIKHNLCLTYESLTSCYVSNLDYIKKYDSRLSGVTGTLGSKPERDLLGLVFNLEFSVIPPFKPKKFTQFPGKISADDKFVNDVAISALGELARVRKSNEYIEGEESIEEEIKSPRAVLIVCTSILDVDIIAREIDNEAKASGLTPKILKYRDEIDAHITERTLDIGDIVIATNLAGRGTDFKTSDILENNGGLHVIEAFLPCNKRVEDQGLGRTGRQGNNGTGQIITKVSEVERLGITVHNEENISFGEILERRDVLEAMRVNDISDNKITELEFKGQLFNKFSLLYGSLKKKNETGPNVVKWIYVLMDLKEKWAFWLEKRGYTAESIKKIIAKQNSLFTKKQNNLPNAVDEEYNEFLKEVNPIINGTISHNPFYSICLSERYLEGSCEKSDREKAKAELEHALNISNSSELLYSAYIKLFEIAVESGGQVLKRYAKAVAKIIFFPIENGCPEYKQNAIKNLNKAAKALEIEHDYLEQLINGEESVLGSIIISKKEESDTDSPNLFLKHLQARLVCLAAYKGNIESLLKQIRGENELEEPKDSIGPSDGAIIDAKVPKYLSKLDDKNEIKKYVTDKSVNELEYVGMSSVYQLRKIHDVHEEVIAGAQIQIGGAIALLASAAVFPLLLPVNGPLAGAMISEGITDIITALIQQGQTAFDKKDYIKGKVISYGISLLTMGIGALMSSTKVLNKAMNACRNLAAKLRAVKGPFAGICKFLANQLDKIAKTLELMIEKIELARKLAADKAKYLCNLKDANQLQKFQQLQKSVTFTDAIMSTGQQITQIVAQAAVGAVQGVVISIAMEKIVIASLSNVMAGLQPVIEQKVLKAVSVKIKEEYKKGTFDKLSDDEINQNIEKLFQTTLFEDIEDVSREIGLGILRHSNNWKMQLATLAFESILSGIEIATHTNKICDKFIANLSNQGVTKNDSDRTKLIETIITTISKQISGVLYAKIVAITGKVAVTLPKALYRGYKEHQENKQDAKAIADMRQKLNDIETSDNAAKAENTKCAHDAVSETLGFDSNKGSKQLADATNLGASTEGTSLNETKQLFLQNGIPVTSCNIEDAQSQFKALDSDRGVVCLSNDSAVGHVIPVTMNKHDNCLMVTEAGKTITLDQYKQNHGYTKGEVIIPKGVNSSTLPDIQHKCNLNRITNATDPISYVGQDSGRKFGHKPGSNTKNAKLERKQEKQKREEEIKKLQDEYAKVKPPHSVIASDELKQSDGTTGAVSNEPGHPNDHLTHDGFRDKPMHTVFPHGEDQQKYIVNQASKLPEFQDKAKAAQETGQRQTVILPIDKVVSKLKLSPKTARKYKEVTTGPAKASRNMKKVIIVIDPPIPGSNKSYHIQTMYGEI